jgi:hypothetical protein
VTFFLKRPFPVTEDSNETPAGAGGKALLQYEADAKAIREKTARLRELRLAREAANPSASAAASSKRSAVKKTPRKGDAKAQGLADWLATQEKEGRRN